MVSRKDYGKNEGFNYKLIRERNGEYIVELYYNDYHFCTSVFEDGMDLDRTAADIVYEYMNCDFDAITTKVLFKRMSERYF